MFEVLKNTYIISLIIRYKYQSISDIIDELFQIYLYAITEYKIHSCLMNIQA